MAYWQPLLGAKVTDPTKLRYPLFASYKLDGIRAHWFGKEFLSRTMKTIPNRALQKVFAGLDLPSGLDGELIYGDPAAKDAFRKTDSAVMTIHGSADDIRFFIFDNYEETGGFARRFELLPESPPYLIRLDQVLVDNPSDLLEFEQKALSLGYEGVVLRAPDGRYKNGRSTLSEQYLLKLKRFTDAEAIVIGFEELLHNANTAERDERGYVKRSSHQENKIPMGKLGALVVSMGSVQFNIGTGFTEQDRNHIWQRRDEHVGKLVKFKYFSVGMKDLPRHPVFLGWRNDL